MGGESDEELQGCAGRLCFSLGQPQSSSEGDFALSFGLETSQAARFLPWAWLVLAWAGPKPQRWTDPATAISKHQLSPSFAA